MCHPKTCFSHSHCQVFVLTPTRPGKPHRPFFTSLMPPFSSDSIVAIQLRYFITLKYGQWQPCLKHWKCYGFTDYSHACQWFQAYWRYSISHIFPCCLIKPHIKILLQHNLPKRQLKKKQTFCLDCWKQSNHEWMILFHIWWNFPLMCLTDSGHIHVCLSHTLHPWNSNRLNLMCSVSIFFFYSLSE